MAQGMWPRYGNVRTLQFNHHQFQIRVICTYTIHYSIQRNNNNASNNKAHSPITTTSFVLITSNGDPKTAKTLFLQFFVNFEVKTFGGEWVSSYVYKMIFLYQILGMQWWCL